MEFGCLKGNTTVKRIRYRMSDVYTYPLFHFCHILPTLPWTNANLVERLSLPRQMDVTPQQPLVGSQTECHKQWSKWG